MAARAETVAPHTKTLHHHAAPFPPIALSENDKQAMRDAMHGFLQEGVEDFEQYVQHPQLPVDEWTLLRQRDGMLMFLREADPTAPSALTTLLGVGTVPGPLSDCMFGSAAATTDQGRLRDAYMRELATDFTPMAMLEEPTPSDPYRTMRVSWLVKTLPLALSAFVKNSDSILIEATGMTSFPSTGERIGYSLTHSVKLPECPPLKAYTRVDVSLLTLIRAHSATRAEIYLRTFTHLNHVKTAKVALRSFVNDMLNFAGYASAGQHRKLAWMLQHRAPCATRGGSHDPMLISSSSSCTSASAPLENVGRSRPVVCRGCSKKTERRFARQHKPSCAMCRSPVCSTCAVKKTLQIVASANELRECVVRLCPACWHDVKHTDTDQLAADEILQRQSTTRQRYHDLRLLHVHSG